MSIGAHSKPAKGAAAREDQPGKPFGGAQSGTQNTGTGVVPTYPGPEGGGEPIGGKPPQKAGKK